MGSWVTIKSPCLVYTSILQEYEGRKIKEGREERERNKAKLKLGFLPGCRNAHSQKINKWRKKPDSALSLYVVFGNNKQQHEINPMQLAHHVTFVTSKGLTSLQNSKSNWSLESCHLLRYSCNWIFGFIYMSGFVFLWCLLTVLGSLYSRCFYGTTEGFSDVKLLLSTENIFNETMSNLDADYSSAVRYGRQIADR